MPFYYKKFTGYAREFAKVTFFRAVTYKTVYNPPKNNGINKASKNILHVPSAIYFPDS
jgi:hypothetical protein